MYQPKAAHNEDCKECGRSRERKAAAGYAAVRSRRLIVSMSVLACTPTLYCCENDGECRSPKELETNQLAMAGGRGNITETSIVAYSKHAPRARGNDADK